MKPQLYALFELHDNQWIRLGDEAYPLVKAQRVYRQDLLEYFVHLHPYPRSLRPVDYEVN